MKKAGGNAVLFLPAVLSCTMAAGAASPTVAPRRTSTETDTPVLTAAAAGTIEPT
jgi:hypothetical protein